jgi:hypothetical protein
MPNSEGRFYYYVRPALTRWEVTFGEEGSCFMYETQEEAIESAMEAAKLNWEKHGVPSGVRLEIPGRVGHSVRTFGPSAGLASFPPPSA